MFLKDYTTRKKSITITAWAVTFLLAFTVCLLTVVGHVTGDWVVPVPVALTAITFNGMYVALYWKKRARLGLDGVEISNDQ